MYKTVSNLILLYEPIMKLYKKKWSFFFSTNLLLTYNIYFNKYYIKYYYIINNISSYFFNHYNKNIILRASYILQPQRISSIYIQNNFMISYLKQQY